MAQRPDPTPEQLAALAQADYNKLRALWFALFDRPPPLIKRRLIVLLIAHRLQEEAYGGLASAARRRLRRMVHRAEQNEANEPRAAAVQLAPGTRLLRRWKGETQVVEVTETGYLWRNSQYSSLTGVASAITGTHYSGPLFFGLKGKGK